MSTYAICARLILSFTSPEGCVIPSKKMSPSPVPLHPTVTFLEGVTSAAWLAGRPGLLLRAGIFLGTALGEDSSGYYAVPPRAA